MWSKIMFWISIPLILHQPENFILIQGLFAVVVPNQPVVYISHTWFLSYISYHLKLPGLWKLFRVTKRLLYKYPLLLSPRPSADNNLPSRKGASGKWCVGGISTNPVTHEQNFCTSLPRSSLKMYPLYKNICLGVNKPETNFSAFLGIVSSLQLKSNFHAVHLGYLSQCFCLSFFIKYKIKVRLFLK